MSEVPHGLLDLGRNLLVRMLVRFANNPHIAEYRLTNVPYAAHLEFL